MEKQKWVCPHALVEQFVANEYIAKCTLTITKSTTAGANCVNPKHYNNGNVNSDGSGHKRKYGSYRVTNVFTEVSYNCGTKLPSTGYQTGDYYGMTSGQTLFAFNTYNIHVSDGSAWDTDSCYGALQNPGSSTTTVVPWS